MKTIKSFLRCAMLIVVVVMGASCLTSCSKDDEPNQEVTLENALEDGNIVVLSFNLNGKDFYVSFIKVGDSYELMGDVTTRGEGGDTSSVPALSEQDLNFTMEHDKAKDLLLFFVKEKKTSDFVMTAVFDIKQSTFEVIPGNSQIKVTGFKMKVSNVEITQLLKDNTGNVTLADALVKGAKVEIVYKWYDSSTTFTFTNDGGTYSCKVTGNDAELFAGSLKSEGNTLTFSADNWADSECNFAIKFNVLNNTYKFWTIRYEVYKSHSISVNGTDITSTLTEER